MSIRTQLAKAYAMGGRDDDAIRTARLILSWDHGNNGPAKFAKALIGELEGGTAASSDGVDTAEP